MFNSGKKMAVAGLLVALTLSSCSSGSDKSGGTTKSGTTKSDSADQGTRSQLDIAASSLVKVQSAKYDGYKIDGDTVKLMVRDGVELNGSECLIVNSATEVDYPDTKFVVVEPNGNETNC